MKNIKNKYNKAILLLLIISLFIIGAYDFPEVYKGADKLYHDLFLPIAISYVMAFVFYILTVVIPQYNTNKERAILLELWYNIINKRLCDCLFKIEKNFLFSDMSNTRFQDELFGAFTLSGEGLKAISLLIETMKKQDEIHSDYCKKMQKDSDVFSFSDEAVLLYDRELKTIFIEIKTVVFPQIFLYENDNYMKKVLLELYNNMSDTQIHIDGHMEVCNGEIYKHLIRFIEHIEKIYKVCLERGYKFNESYKS